MITIFQAPFVIEQMLKYFIIIDVNVQFKYQESF